MKQEGGFTLIELLAALTAGSLLLATLSWSLAGTVQMLGDPVETRARQEVATMAPALVQLIEQAQPLRPGDKLEASANHLQLRVPAPAAAGAAGLLQMTLRVAARNGHQALYLDLAPEDARQAWPAAARTTLLAEGYESIRLAYDFPTGKGAEERLPRLVTISFKKGERTERLSARPRIDNDGACRFDPISMACRS
jgi:prepilin-type N-terminal cleavage/methylation domain-containing protein